MNLRRYLIRIGLAPETPLQADLATLTLLHAAHVFHVPFENLDIHLGRKIEIDCTKFYKKIVENYRGGFCYELNGLFYTLLKQLGFDAKLLSCRMCKEGATLGPDTEHMAIWVILGNKNYLADTGLGYGFIEPLEVVAKNEVVQNGDSYRIERYEADSFKLMRCLQEEESFRDKYVFILEERQLEEFVTKCHEHQTSPQSNFTKKRVCTKPVAGGRVTLSNLKLILTREGRKTRIILKDEEEFIENLWEYFAITLF